MYRQDKEYMAEVGHLIQHPKLQKLKEIPHHIHSNRLAHSIQDVYKRQGEVYFAKTYEEHTKNVEEHVNSKLTESSSN